MAALNCCAYSSVGGIKAVRSKGVHTYDKRLVMENLELDAKFFVGEVAMPQSGLQQSELNDGLDESS